MFSLIRGHTPPIKPAEPFAEAVLEPFVIDGIRQWMTIRSFDIRNPLLLFVHGGPGVADIGALRRFIPELERHFIVVHWSQRGAGKSYSSSIPESKMKIAYFVDDLIQLAERLLRRYGRRKLILVGHSWGSLLGIRAVYRRPDLFHAYVGVNQTVDRAKEELISYHSALQTAEQRGETLLLAKLQTMGEPVHQGLYEHFADNIIFKALTKKLDMITHDPERSSEFIQTVMFSSELTLRERMYFTKATNWNLHVLWSEFCRANLFVEIDEMQIPIYFVVGRYDRYMNAELAGEFLEELAAPFKQWVRFDQSGHLACYEEPRRFLELMLAVRDRHLQNN